MNTHNIIPISDLRKLLRANFLTGQLFWLLRPVEMFSHCKNPRRAMNSWNTQNAGNQAFTSNTHGYKYSTIFKRRFSAHRVIFTLFHGRWPDTQLDHFDQDRANNKISNLREFTQLQNMKNARMKSNNTSGFTGVKWDKRHKKWLARIYVNKREKFLGYFDTKEEAAEARKVANVKYGYSSNHGRNIKW